MFRDKTILITGGSGSLGEAIAKLLLSNGVKSVRILSNDEWQQVQMQRFCTDERLRFLIGDVRDRDRMYRAMNGVNIVIHCAALKHIPICEYNPIEAVKTNILGSINVIDSAIDNEVEKVLAISSDKAVHPINLYGATKLAMEKLITQANVYGTTKFSCVRYGNFGGRGSVVPQIMQQVESGKVTITDKDMARFWMTLEHASSFTLQCLEMMEGGEVFIPKMTERGIMDIVREIAPEVEIEIIGKRAGEKLHEQLFAEGEQPLDKGDFLVIL